MSVTGKVKEAAGYVKEEAHEHGKSAESQRKAAANEKVSRRLTRPPSHETCEA